jgi:hypothetical protein
VASGQAEDGPRPIDVRPLDEPFVYDPFQIDANPSGLPGAGEAGVQGGAEASNR